MTTIGVDTDPIVFFRNLLVENVRDKNNEIVSTIRTAYPLTLAQIPCIVIIPFSEDSEWITVGAHRQRWYKRFDVQVWARDVEDRFIITKNLRKRIWDVAKTSLADNYVWIHILTDAVNDEVMLSGTPIYRSILYIELIYDITSYS